MSMSRIDVLSQVIHEGIGEDIQASRACNDLADIAEELLSALEYCSSYLDENKLNSIASGSKAHMEMQDAIASAKPKPRPETPPRPPVKPVA